MTRATVAALALVALGVLWSCTGPEDPRSTGSANLSAVHTVADSFVIAVRQQDPEQFAALFTEDATYASNDGRLWQGREEILGAAREWMQIRQVPERTTVEAEVAGDVAYLLELYTTEIELPNASNQTVTGKSLTVFRRQEDGSWRIHALVVNRDPAQ